MSLGWSPHVTGMSLKERVFTDPTTSAFRAFRALVAWVRMLRPSLPSFGICCSHPWIPAHNVRAHDALTKRTCVENSSDSSHLIEIKSFLAGCSKRLSFGDGPLDQSRTQKGNLGSQVTQRGSCRLSRVIVHPFGRGQLSSRPAVAEKQADFERQAAVVSIC